MTQKSFKIAAIMAIRNECGRKGHPLKTTLREIRKMFLWHGKKPEYEYPTWRWVEKCLNCEAPIYYNLKSEKFGEMQYSLRIKDVKVRII